MNIDQFDIYMSKIKNDTMQNQTEINDQGATQIIVLNKNGNLVTYMKDPQLIMKYDPALNKSNHTIIEKFSNDLKFTFYNGWGSQNLKRKKADTKKDFYQVLAQQLFIGRRQSDIMKQRNALVFEFHVSQ